MENQQSHEAHDMGLELDFRMREDALRKLGKEVSAL